MRVGPGWGKAGWLCESRGVSLFLSSARSADPLIDERVGVCAESDSEAGEAAVLGRLPGIVGGEPGGVLCAMVYAWGSVKR